MKTFYAAEINRSAHLQNGEITNVFLKIWNSCFIVSQARAQFLNMRAVFYLYLNDVDEFHKIEMENGAEVEFKPADMDYRYRTLKANFQLELTLVIS